MPCAAIGLAPVAYSFRPGADRARNSETAISATMVMLTTGGIGSPKVVPTVEVSPVSTAGGAPMMFDCVAIRTPPIRTEDIPRVTTSDWTRKKWQMALGGSTRYPGDGDDRSATAQSGQPWWVGRTTEHTAPTAIYPGTAMSMPPIRMTSVWPREASASRQAIRIVARIEGKVAKPSSCKLAQTTSAIRTTSCTTETVYSGGTVGRAYNDGGGPQGGWCRKQGLRGSPNRLLECGDTGQDHSDDEEQPVHELQVAHRHTCRGHDFLQQEDRRGAEERPDRPPRPPASDVPPRAIAANAISE